MSSIFIDIFRFDFLFRYLFMLKSLFVTFLTLFVSCQLLAQISPDRIEITRTSGGLRYSKNGETLKIGHLVKVMKNDQQAYRLIKKASSNNSFSTVVGCVGGVMIGGPLAFFIAGKDPRWVVAGIGAGLGLISIPIHNIYEKQTKLAVDTYNTNLTSTNRDNLRTTYSIGLTSSGMGLLIKF